MGVHWRFESFLNKLEKKKPETFADKQVLSKKLLLKYQLSVNVGGGAPAKQEWVRKWEAAELDRRGEGNLQETAKGSARKRPASRVARRLKGDSFKKVKLIQDLRCLHENLDNWWRVRGWIGGHMRRKSNTHAHTNSRKNTNKNVVQERKTA